MIDELKPIFVEEISGNVDHGYIIITKKYGTAVHRCPCGCKNLVVTPIKKNGWKLTDHDDDTISLSPSISNPTIRCKSHYWIKQNKIVWAEEPVK